MLRPEPRIDRVYLHRAPIDMRKYAPTKVMGCWLRTGNRWLNDSNQIAFH
jgi:hypothetical protein